MKITASGYKVLLKGVTMAKLYESREWLFYMLYNKNMKPVDIAKKLNVSPQTIYTKIKEFGFDKRK